MPYIKCTIKAGNTVEIKKYFSARYGKKCRRSARRAETEDKQKRVNENNAEDKLRWLINSNFNIGDLYLTLTYGGKLPPKREEAARILETYIRRLRRAYRKRGKELKYIAVTEYKANRIHHHIIVNDIDHKIISSLWNEGKIHFETLYSADFSKLASYLIKETNRTYKDGTVSGKRWNASRNLTQPEIHKEVIKADSWREIPQDTKEYTIQADSIVNGFDYYGYPYQKYIMIKNKSNVLHRLI